MRMSYFFKYIFSKYYPFKSIYKKLNNQFVRDVFVAQELKKLKKLHLMEVIGSSYIYGEIAIEVSS